jgi:TetR/AcrR family transcriptional repressor of nem operon
MERGLKDGSLKLSSEPRVEAEAFMATVHGAMLSARAYGAPEIFATILAPTLQRLSPTAAQ